eukprot:TRINITY_DN522_c0_g1_i5.p1 TRINITY_DN522_c0_g1~~TRINITY_DN522_c0_g1_i5.p1  ORF type:complete len:556 (+),score=118.00 TRINITY_DN522_c0_g1_i5:92-1759(+)
MAMKPPSLVSCAVFFKIAFSSYMTLSSGKGFLSVREIQEVVVDSRGPADLLAELERLDQNSGHEEAVRSRTKRLQDALEPLFKLAPKDDSGRIDVTAARYVLHRLFLQRHGWHINGIEAQSVVWHNTTVEEALNRGGKFDLSDLALFAATLEVLVHSENMERLQKAFDALNFTKQQPNSVTDAKQVIEAYMVFFAMAYHYPERNPEYKVAKRLVRNILDWHDTQAFADEIRQSVFEAIEDEKAQSLWEVCLQVVEEIGERYGRWQNKDCVALKSKMLEMETAAAGPGRVPLTDFWRPYLKGRTLFHENMPYLEQIGALEGEAPRQSVLIPNYLYSSANCAAGSKYYTVCCINECDTLLGDIEAHVGESAATPQRLADFISTLSSSSVSAPGELSAELMQRLEEISAHHGGLVPLHGRLFAQFLHHVFPRECPYPHVSSSGPDGRDTRIVAGTAAAKVTRAEVEAYLQAAENEEEAEDSSESCKIRWTNEEELFMQSSCSGAGSSVEGTTTEIEAPLRTARFGLLLPVGAMAVALWRRRDSLLGSSSKDFSKSVLV